MALLKTYFGLLVKYLPLNSVSKETKSYFTSDSESRNIEVENSEKKKSFECPRCSKCFGTKQILKNHLNRKKRCLQLNPEPVQYSGFQDGQTDILFIMLTHYVLKEWSITWLD